MTYCISYYSIAIIKYSDRKPLIEDRANFGLIAPEGESSSWQGSQGNGSGKFGGGMEA